jgi:hypothetical protein
MAGESPKDTGEDRVESLIDELIGDILNEAGPHAETPARGLATAAALFETAFGSGAKQSRASMLERIFIAEAFASELADALAPTLAEQLAPRLIRALEQYMADKSEGKKPEPGGRTGSQSRKSEGR